LLIIFKFIKVKKRHSSKDPGPLLWIGVLVIFIGWIFFGFIFRFIFPIVDETTLKQVGQVTDIFGVLFGLFIGAIVYKCIYDYINHEKQKRDWRHDFAIRHQEEIYSPIWMSTNEIMMGISKYYEPAQLESLGRSYGPDLSLTTSYTINRSHHQYHDDIINGPLQLFIDKNALSLLKSFINSVNKYKEIHVEADKAINEIVFKSIYNLAQKKGIIGSENALREIFLAGPSGTCFAQIYEAIEYPELEKKLKKEFSDAYSIIPNLQIKDADSEFDVIFSQLKNQKDIIDFLAERKNSLTHGKTLIERIKEIIQDQTKVVFE